MDVLFDDELLDRLETDPDFTGGFTRAIVKAFRKRMMQIRAALTEREFVKSIGGGCKVPLGTFSCLQGNRLLLYACILSPDGKTKIQLKDSGDPNLPKELGKKTAMKMLEMGAKELIEHWRI